MAETYLIDSNVIIQYTGNYFPESSAIKLDSIFNENFYYSIISRMEVLGYDSSLPDELSNLSSFLSLGTQYDVNSSISEKVIELRPKLSKKIKLPDLIIAATAIVHNHILLTRNTPDFSIIPNLKIENPWDWK